MIRHAPRCKGRGHGPPLTSHSFVGIHGRFILVILGFIPRIFFRESLGWPEDDTLIWQNDPEYGSRVAFSGFAAYVGGKNLIREEGTG